MAKGYVAVMIDDPFGDEPQRQLYKVANYTQDRPGVIKFAKDVGMGEIHEGHDGKDLAALAMIVFKPLADKRGTKFVEDSLAKVDESIKAAQAEALINEWRDRLDDVVDQAGAADLFAMREDLKAQFADLDADIAAQKADIAAELGISKTFDLSLIGTGWYVTAKTEGSGGGQSVPRLYNADVYEVERTLRGIKVKSTATITERNADGSPAMWHVRYEILDGDHKGKVYECTDPSLNKADNRRKDSARRTLMDELDLPGKRRNGVPTWYKIPAVTQA